MPTALAEAPTRLLTALIYARVSHDPKANGRSVDEQVAECRTWAEREGWDVVDVIRDNDRSATRYRSREREGWAKVHERLARGNIDVVVTWAASRAQRDLDAYVELRRVCAEHGVRWAYSGTVYDLTNRQDRFRTGLDALVAEDEAERNREAVLRAMRANAAKGRPHGRLPYGYRRIYDEHTRELLRQEPDPEQEQLVQEAARRLLAGESARSIANDWNGRGIPSPHVANRRNRGLDGGADHGWQLTQIRRIVSNPAVVAKRVHRDKVVGPGGWDAILDDETYARLQAHFADPARRSTRHSPTARLLAGCCRCGVCGGPMVATKQSTPAEHVERYVYACRYRHCVARDLRALDAYVTAVVLDHLRRSSAAELLDGDDLDASARDALAEIVTLQAQLDEAKASYLAHTRGERGISITLLADIESDLLPRIAQAQRRVRYSALPTIAAELAGSDDVAADWGRLSVEQRRAVVQALFEIVVLPVPKRGRRNFDPACVRIEQRR